jgi:Rieske Fe-S protein
MSTTRHGEPAPPADLIASAGPDGLAGDGEHRSTDGQVTRRQWVRHVAIAGTVVAAGTGLAACGTSTPKSSGPAPGATRGSVPAGASSTGSGATTTPSTSAITSTATPQTAPADTGGDASPAFAVGKVSAVPVGGGVIYPSHGVVVTQPTSGAFRCFSSSCTHLGCTVNKVADGLIQCPCHGARFSIDDGSVKAGPAPRPLTVEQFTIKDGVVVLD